MMKIMDKTSRLVIDEGLPKRVLNISLALAALIFLISISSWSPEVTLGLSLGMGISIIFSMILYRTIKFLVASKKPGAKLLFGAVTFLKFIALCIALFFILRNFSINYIALVAGVSLVQIVIFLKLAGMGLVNYMNMSNQRRVEGA